MHSDWLISITQPRFHADNLYKYRTRNEVDFIYNLLLQLKDQDYCKTQLTTMEQNGEETKEVQTFTDQDNLTEVKLVQKKMKGQAKSVNRNKTVECKVCFRKMRSDHLKQHMKTHLKIFTLKEEEMREEIKEIIHIRNERRNHERAIQKIADEEGISPENCGINVSNTLPQDEVSEKDEKEAMNKDHQRHQRMIERGKRISNIMNRENIGEGSLSGERKHALDLYIRSLSRDTQIRAFYRREIPYMYRKNRKLKLQKEQFRF